MDNKTLVLTAMTELLKGDAAVIERYWGDPYIQHSPLMPPGRDALYGVIEMIKQNPAIKFEAVRAIAEGDYVVVHGRFAGFDPQPMVGFDLFRVENGKIVEHWDAAQPESSPAMLDGETGIRDLDKTDANKQLVHALASQAFDKVHRVVGEGNFVFTQSEGTLDGQRCAFYDLFRVENGTAAERWRVVQAIPAEPKNDNGVF